MRHNNNNLENAIEDDKIVEGYENAETTRSYMFETVYREQFHTATYAIAAVLKIQGNKVISWIDDIDYSHTPNTPTYRIQIRYYGKLFDRERAIKIADEIDAKNRKEVK